MAMLVHLTPENKAKSIQRAGIKLPRFRSGIGRGVFAMPVTDNYFVSHQWLRELKRSGQRVIVAVHFRIPDDQPVLIGHYNNKHIEVTAAQALGIMSQIENAEGYQVIVPRAIDAAEIHAIRHLPKVVGWRYFPGAHGRPPCGCPVCQPRGEIKSRRIRDQYDQP